MAEVDPELKTDALWQLIERITASPSFQKSARIRDLLRYMAERTLHGQTQDLISPSTSKPSSGLRPSQVLQMQRRSSPHA